MYRKRKIDKTQQWLQRKGSMMGFFAFVPVIGDAIVIALGFMRANFWKVIIFMTIGKFLRYVAVGFGTEQILLHFKKLCQLFYFMKLHMVPFIAED